MTDLRSFFDNRHFYNSPSNHASLPLQVGKRIIPLSHDNFDWSQSEIVLIGCGEQRGSVYNQNWSYAADAIREELYTMYDWHPDIKVADAGNLLEGSTIEDTRASLRTVLNEIHNSGRVAIILGGSQDLTLQQYEAFKKSGTTINAAVIDMLIDLSDGYAYCSTKFC
jgi:formiminoglutamase